MSSSISLSVLLQQSISLTQSGVLLLFCTPLFLKASLAMWYPELNCLLTYALVLHRVFIMSPAWWHKSINAEAAHNCTGLVCCFHLPHLSPQMSCTSDSSVFFDRGKAFKPQPRADLLAFGLVQKLPLLTFCRGNSLVSLGYSSHMTLPTCGVYLGALLSVAHLICNIIVHLKIQEPKTRLSSLSLLRWV